MYEISAFAISRAEPAGKRVEVERDDAVHDAPVASDERDGDEATAEPDLERDLRGGDGEHVAELAREHAGQVVGVLHEIAVAVRLLRKARHEILVVVHAQADRRDGDAVFHEERAVAT